jgi:hypothetical protein
MYQTFNSPKHEKAYKALIGKTITGVGHSDDGKLYIHFGDNGTIRVYSADIDTYPTDEMINVPNDIQFVCEEIK